MSITCPSSSAKLSYTVVVHFIIYLFAAENHHFYSANQKNYSYAKDRMDLPSRITPPRAANIVLQQLLDAKYIATAIEIRILLTMSVKLFA